MANSVRPTATLSTNDLGSVTGAEYLSGEELRRIAEELTKHPNVTLIGFPVPFDFVDRLAAERRTITAVYRSARDASAAGETLTPAAEWLLDNFYLIEENLSQVAHDLPPKFYRQLPAGVVASDSRATTVRRVLRCSLNKRAHRLGRILEPASLSVARRRDVDS